MVARLLAAGADPDAMVMPQEMVGLGLDRIVVSEIEAPNLLANLV